MTPGQRLKAARGALGLSAEQFAALRVDGGRPLAQSGRTVRRWEDDSQDIPGAVMALTIVLKRSPHARRIMGLPVHLATAAAE